MLKQAQKFHLEVRRKFAHFVEEERAAFGLFYAAGRLGNDTHQGATFATEELAVQNGFRHRGAMDADERAHVAVGTVMDSFGHEPLARTDLAHDKRRQGAAGHLVNLRIHALHFARATDDIVRMKTVLELQGQAFVFGLQEFIFFAGFATELHCRRKHLCDNFKQAELFREFFFDRILDVGTEGANHLVFHNHGHAKEGLVFGLTAPCTIQEVRVFCHRGNDNRLTGFHDAAGNTFTHLVAALARLTARKAFCNFNGDFTGMAVVQREGRVFHAHRRFHHLQNRMRDAFEIKRLVQNGTDLVEQFQFLDFGLRGRQDYLLKNPENRIQRKSQTGIIFCYGIVYRVKFQSENILLGTPGKAQTRAEHKGFAVIIPFVILILVCLETISFFIKGFGPNGTIYTGISSVLKINQEHKVRDNGEASPDGVIKVDKNPFGKFFELIFHAIFAFRSRCSEFGHNTNTDERRYRFHHRKRQACHRCRDIVPAPNEGPDFDVNRFPGNAGRRSIRHKDEHEKKS